MLLEAFFSFLFSSPMAGIGSWSWMHRASLDPVSWSYLIAPRTPGRMLLAGELAESSTHHPCALCLDGIMEPPMKRHFSPSQLQGHPCAEPLLGCPLPPAPSLPLWGQSHSQEGTSHTKKPFRIPPPWLHPSFCLGILHTKPGDLSHC